MKTKNDLKTGILIGIGMIVIPLLLMGTTNYSIEKTNKWEFHQEGQSSHNRGYLLNTENGEVYYLSNSSKTLCK